MSYIEKNTREVLLAAPLGICPIENNEELSFVILTLMRNYIQKYPQRVIGTVVALENVRSEYERTIMIPHNKQQQYENGDV